MPNPLLIPPVAEIAVSAGKMLIDRLWPDKDKQAAERFKAETELYMLQRDERLQQMQHDLQLAIAQAQTNQAEAAAPDLFVRGWRPFVGWVCGAAFSYNYFFGPLLAQVVPGAAFQPLDLSEMMPVLFGMLGLGAYRTFEKLRGVSR